MRRPLHPAVTALLTFGTAYAVARILAFVFFDHQGLY